MKSETKKRIDPIKRALELRETLKKEDNVLVVDYTSTLQGEDTSKVIDTMPNINTGEHVFRFKFNVKEADPLARKEYKRDFFDVSEKTDNEIEDFVKKQEFDFPLWYKHTKGFKMKNILDYNPPQIVQVAGCNFHDGSPTGGCWYCFVDNKSNDGKPCAGKAYLNIKDNIESAIANRERVKSIYKEEADTDMDIKVLRFSGGEPTIALDYLLELWREIDKKGLDFVGQLDTNLSTGRVVDKFEKEGIYEKNILEKLSRFEIKVLTALKGCDEQNMQDNVQALTTLEDQEYSLKKILKAGLDIYPQAYNLNPKTLEKYLTNIDTKIKNFSLKIHIGPLKIYGPNTQRLTLEAERLGINPDEFIKKTQEKWDSNYKNSCEVINDYLIKAYGVGYKETVRPDVELKVIE